MLSFCTLTSLRWFCAIRRLSLYCSALTFIQLRWVEGCRDVAIVTGGECLHCVAIHFARTFSTIRLLQWGFTKEMTHSPAVPRTTEGWGGGGGSGRPSLRNWMSHFLSKIALKNSNCGNVRRKWIARQCELSPFSNDINVAPSAVLLTEAEWTLKKTNIVRDHKLRKMGTCQRTKRMLETSRDVESWSWRYRV